MDRKFKCCRSRDFTSYCCTVCLGVFHPRCLDKMESAKKLGGYRIYCTDECESRDAERKQRQAKSDGEIDSLREECRQKDLFINRLKRQSHQFEQDVADAERSYVDKVTQQAELISSLQVKLNDFAEKKK